MTPSSTVRSPYIVERLFRRNQISFVTGPVYSGKTTLMLQILDNYIHGRNVMGRESHPEPTIFVSTITPADECIQLAQRIGAADIEILSVFGNREKPTFKSIVELALRTVPGLSIMFLDGVHRLSLGNMNDPCVASDSMSEIYSYLRQYDLTLVASGCSSKPKEQYSTGRDRFAGAFSWMQSSSCYVFIDYINSKKSKRDHHKREITLHPKDGAPETATYYFNSDGRLEPHDGTSLDVFRFRNFDEQLRYMGEGGELMETGQLYEIGSVSGLPESTIDRHLADLVDVGTLEHPMHGRYRLRRPS